jgi:hypothetical protein
VGRRLLGSFGFVVLLLWRVWVTQAQAQSPFHVAAAAVLPDAALTLTARVINTSSCACASRVDADGLVSFLPVRSCWHRG